MSDGDGLLADILDHPDDDVPRLIYADWLDDHGEPGRAEFIRDQVLWLPGSHDLDLLDAHLEAWCPWFERHDVFGFRRCSNWGGALEVEHHGGETTYWRRGFIHRVELKLPAFLKHAASLFRGHPVTEVRLTCRTPHPDSAKGGELFSHECPGWVREGADDVEDGDAFTLPVPLWSLLGPPRRFSPDWADYESVEGAHADLSRACVRFGREAARGPRPCPACKGEGGGVHGLEETEWDCETCGGTGRGGSP